jgi:hypothetical protein
MKIFFSFLFLAFTTSAVFSQKLADLDKSPMDMAYYPNNFAHDRKPGEKAVIRVTYSRPGKNGRDIFGKTVPFGKVWRAGANENTEIKFYQDVELGGQRVKAGTYSLFVIPDEKDWTIILNSDLDYWGAYSYKEKNDVIRVKAPVNQSETTIENFTIQFQNNGAQQGLMKLGWDKSLATIPFKVI